MKSLVALCADLASLQHPEILGLAGENFAAQEWLRLFTSARDARTFLETDYLVDEVWVVSSDDVSPINLAATLKHDRSDRCVCLVAFEGTGSLKSRASAAGIDMSLTRQAFIERYAHRKRLSRGEDGESNGWSSNDQRNKVDQLDKTDQNNKTIKLDEKVILSTPNDFSTIRAQSQPEASLSANKTDIRTTTGFLLPVVSGSGGAGKSTIATLSALLLRRMGLRTLLLDFDLQFGDTLTFLGVENPTSIDEVLAASARMELLNSQDDLPALLAPPRHLEQSEMVVEQAPVLLDQLLARFDVVVSNTGAAWAEQHALLLERSSKALFLVDQRPSSLRACKHALELCTRCGIATSPFSFVVNRCNKNALFTSIDVSCALQGAPVAELAEGGPDVEELLSSGMALELLHSHNALCTSLEEVLRSLPPQNALELNRYANACAGGPSARFRKGSRPRKRRKEAACL